MCTWSHQHYSCILVGVPKPWANMLQDMMSGGASVEDTLELWASSLRDVVRDYVVEHLAADDAVLVIDETGLLK